MKTSKQIVVFLLIILAGATTLFAQNKGERKEQKKQAVKELIVSKNYKITVNTAFPMRGRAISLTSPYSIQVKNDSVFSYLPYYGRAYSIPYDGGQGLIFNTIIENYTIKNDKKGNTDIEFSTKNTEDSYMFRVTVFTNGSASININMQNRQSISFQGELEIDD